VALSVANVLLQITGDSDDARRELEAVSRDLALFGRETAEAEADIDTTAAIAHLDELKARLAEFSADDHSTEVNVQIAKAQADLAVLQTELNRIDGENVTVDVDVRRGIVEKIASLTGQIERLGDDLGGVATEGAQSFTSALGEAFNSASFFGVGLRGIAIAAPLVIAILVALAGQLLAVAASAASALGGIGALSIALLATLAPALALVGGAIANFKKDSETAGTAAYALKGNFEDLANVFTDATSGGADALFRGLSDGIREFAPLLAALERAFTELGLAGGDALRDLAVHFSSPAWRDFFSFATESLAKLTPKFTETFKGVSDILKNVTEAAMPSLESVFGKVNEGIGSLSDRTSDVQGLRGVISGMVGSLEKWAELLGGVADLAVAFTEAFAPFGDEIVKSLADGAHGMADWLRSAEGLEKTEDFFEKTGPLARESTKSVGGLSLALTQLGALFAPVITPAIEVFNGFLDVLNDVLSFFNTKLSAGALSAIGTALTGLFLSPLGLIATKFGSIKDAAKDAFDAIKSAASTVGGAIASGLSSALSSVVSTAANIAAAAVDSVRGKVAEATAVGQAIFNGVRTGFNAVRSDVVSVARVIAQAAVESVRSKVSAARSAGQAVFNAVRVGFNAVRGAAVGVARAIGQASVGAVRALVSTARGAGQAVMSAVQGGFNAVRSGVVSAARDIATGAVNAVKALIGSAKGAGQALGNAVASGITAAIGAVRSAAQSIWNAAKSIIEAPLHIHIDVPDIKIPTPHFAGGVRGRSGSSVALVGEQGPELSFIPQGADVFTASETRRILRALADGVSRPFGGASRAPALAGAGAGTVIGEQNFHFSTPGTGNPDPRVAMAQAALIQRQKGRRA
jgi:phage-related protein